jgi:hypothetical protein
MLFLQDAPANTTVYMVAGYMVIFGLMLIYLISLIVRRRNLQQDVEMLESLEKKDNAE